MKHCADIPFSQQGRHELMVMAYQPVYIEAIAIVGQDNGEDNDVIVGTSFATSHVCRYLK